MRERDISFSCPSYFTYAGSLPPLPNPLVQSLSGHTSAVQSVKFDTPEEFVAAGSVSGTIKLWDLEQQKSKNENN